MKINSKKVLNLRALKRATENTGGQFYLQKFYTEELWSLQNLFKRGKALSYILLCARQVIWIFILFNEKTINLLEKTDSYFKDIRGLWILSQLNSHDNMIFNIQIALLSIHGFLLLGLICQLFVFNAKLIKQKNEQKGLKIQTQKKRQSSIELPRYLDISISVAAKTYPYFLFPLSISLSMMNITGISVILIALALIINLVFIDSDYDLLIYSKDFLRKRQSSKSIAFLFIEAAIVLVNSFSSKETSIIINLGLSISSLIFDFYLKLYFDVEIQKFNAKISLFAILAKSGLLLSVFLPNFASHFFSLYVVLIIPFSHYIGDLMIQQAITLKLTQFEEQAHKKYTEDDKQDDCFDWYMRYALVNFINLDMRSTIGDHNLEKVHLLNVINRLQEIIINQYGQESVEDLKSIEQQTVLVKGEEFISKKSSNQDEELLVQQVKQLIFLMFQRDRRNKKNELSQWDTNYLLYLLEIQNNLQLFELIAVQFKGVQNKKDQQILMNLRKEAEKKINLHKYQWQDHSIFNAKLMDVTKYDELLDEAKEIQFEATEKKLDILLFMKQKYLDLEILNNKLRDLLQKRQKLLMLVQTLMTLNPLNNELYDIYYSYLETLAFSEGDLRISQFRTSSESQINSQKHFITKYSQEGSCVVFAILDKEGNASIQKVSHNFNRMFGLTIQDVRSKPLTILMASPYEKFHQNYLKNFYLRGDPTSNLGEKLLFAQNRNDYIMAVSVQCRINYNITSKQETQFGISGYIKAIEKDKYFIIFDSLTDKVISMTSNSHFRLFSTFDQVQKINLISFFPFIARQNKSQPSSSNINKIKTGVLQDSTQLQFTSLASQNNNLNSIGFSGKMESVNKREMDFENQINEESESNTIKEPVKVRLDQESGKDDNNNTSNYAKNSENHSQSFEFKNKDNLIESKQTVKICNENKGKMSFKDKELLNLMNYKNIEVIENTQYLLITPYQKKIKTPKDSNKKKSYISNKDQIAHDPLAPFLNIQKYQFYQMSINVKTIESQGIKHIKYIEMINVNKISPFFNSSLILSIYKQGGEVIKSNIFSFKKNILKAFLNELQQIEKESQTSISKFIDNDKDPQGKEVELLADASDKETPDKDREEEVQNVEQISPPQFKGTSQKVRSKDIESDLFQAGSQDQTLLSTNQNMLNQADSVGNKLKYVHPQLQFKTQTKEISLPSEVAELQTGDITHNKALGILQQNEIFLNDNSMILDQNTSMSMLNKSQTKRKYHQDESQGLTFYPIKRSEDVTSITKQSNLESSKDNQLNENKSQLNLGRQDSYVLSGNTLHQQQYLSANTQIPKKIGISTQDLMSSHNQHLTAPLQSSQQALKGIKNPLNQQVNFLQLHQENLNKKKKKKQFNSSDSNQRSSQQHVFQLMKQQQQREEIKNLQEALDSSSNHSKESTSSSIRKAMRNLIMSAKHLGVMKIVNLLGLSSLIVIIAVVVQQYVSVTSSFKDFIGDMNAVGWPSQYLNGYSYIIKDLNLVILVYTYTVTFDSSDDLLYVFLQASKEMASTMNNTQNLLSNISTYGKSRSIYKGILLSETTFEYNTLFDYSISLKGQLSTSYSFTVQNPSNLYYALISLFQYLYRYSTYGDYYQYTTGGGGTQYTALSNEQTLTKALKTVSDNGIIGSHSQLSDIKSTVTSVMILLLIILFCCIFISIPLFWLVQNKKQELLALFGTFSSQLIQKEFNDIYTVFANSNYSSNQTSTFKISQKSNPNLETEKRQNLSSNSSLPKFNIYVFMISLFAFSISLPYPIISQIFSTNFVSISDSLIDTLSNTFKTNIYYISFSLIRNVIRNRKYYYQKHKYALLLHVFEISINLNSIFISKLEINYSRFDNQILRIQRLVAV